jgi:hypothetical protein
MQSASVFTTYFALAAMMWFIADATNMHFESSHSLVDREVFMTRFFAASWILPAIIVIVISTVSPEEMTTADSCWINTEGTMFTVASVAFAIEAGIAIALYIISALRGARKCFLSFAIFAFFAVAWASAVLSERGMNRPEFGYLCTTLCVLQSVSFHRIRS